MSGLFQSIKNDIRHQWLYGSTAMQLIIVNCVVFLLILLVRFFTLFINHAEDDHVWKHFINWLAMPYQPITLLYHFYTIITFQFVHISIFHLLGNMLFLYWFGTILESYIGDKRTLSLYLYGGVAGALFSFIAMLGVVHQFPEMSASNLIGASAGITAIMVATAVIAPDHPIQLMFIGEVKLKFIVLVLIVLDFAAVAYMQNNFGGSLAHLGGAALGYLFTKALQNGQDWSAPLNNSIAFVKSIFKPKPKMKAYVNSGNAKKRNSKSDSEQAQLDKILDKISASGYESLSDAEKNFLFKFRQD
jgi:membrane associated rhomboid family serine protease